MRGKDKDASAPAAICRKVLRGSFMTLPDELEYLRKADGSANQISTDCSPAEHRIAAFDFGKRRHVPRAALRQRYTNSLFPRRVQCRPLALNGPTHGGYGKGNGVAPAQVTGGLALRGFDLGAVCRT